MTSSSWTIDHAHTDISFSTRHMMVTTVRGKFTAVDGTLRLDLEDPASSSGRFRVVASSLDTGVEQRDAHLRSADFLATDDFPEITFASTRVVARGGDAYAVTGDLTIRGVTRPTTFDVEFLGLYQGLNGTRRAGLRAKASIDREAWGLTWNVALETGGWLVGKEIRLEIDIAAEEAAVPGSRNAETPAAA
jgi:polyisoprenoid-binding protein YceI